MLLFLKQQEVTVYVSNEEKENSKPQVENENNVVLKEKKSCSFENSRPWPRLWLVSDSHGRNCYKYLTDTQNQFDVSVIFKPNANFNQVVSSIPDLTKDFTANDHVVVMAGTNDVLDCKSNVVATNEFFDISPLLSICKKVNVHVVSIPPRFDVPGTREVIFNMNLCLKNECSSHLNFIESFKLLRSDFVSHGLHLNKFGKKKLCAFLIESVTPTGLSSPQKITTVIGNRVSEPFFPLSKGKVRKRIFQKKAFYRN